MTVRSAVRFRALLLAAGFAGVLAGCVAVPGPGQQRDLRTASDQTDFRFLRFRPPLLAREGGEEPALPHIRLDRALQFLIGDKLQ